MRSRWQFPAVPAARLTAAALTAATLTGTALFAAACGSGGSGYGAGASSPPAAASTSPAASGTVLRTAKIGGKTVLTDAKGFTLYWFAPDTATASHCNGSCAVYWPPVKGPATAGSGVTGKLGTITRSDGSIQATYNGHPLYTYVGDHAPGQATGNEIDSSGGVWYEVTVSGSAAPAPAPSQSSPGGYGGGY